MAHIPHQLGIIRVYILDEEIVNLLVVVVLWHFSCLSLSVMRIRRPVDRTAECLTPPGLLVGVSA